MEQEEKAKELEKNQYDNQNKKDEELYRVALQVFFKNEIESDKILLALSVGAIGFYTSILTKQMSLSKIMLGSMSIALLFYVFTIAVILVIFFRNKKELLYAIENNGRGRESMLLKYLDIFKYLFFIIAIVASLVFVLFLMFMN